MDRLTLKAPQDRIAWAKVSELGPDLHTDEDGGVELLRDNLAPNQYGLEIDELGNAEGYELDPPPTPTGRQVFASDVNGSAQDVRRQTLTPVSINEPWFDFGIPFVSSGSRPVRDPRRTAEIPRPPAAVIEAIAVGVAGFPQGNRTLYLTRTTADGRLHTEPGEGVPFFLNEGEGLRVFVPQSTEPLQGVKVGIWITEVDGGLNTARLQRVVSHDVREVVLDGYTRGRTVPTKDETMLSPPKALRKREVKLVRDNETLKNGIYRFARWYYTPFGTTLASGPSPLFRVNERERIVKITGDGDKKRSDEGDDGEGKEGDAPEKEVTILTGMRRRAYSVPPPKRRPGVTGWGLAVFYNGAWYVASKSASTRDGARLPFGRRVEVNGKLGEANKAGGVGFIEEELPEENTSGVAGLDSAPEDPAAVTLSGVRPPAGTRWYTYTNVITDSSGGEKTSLPAPAVKFNAAFGFIARVKFPDTNNLIENAEGRRRKADGTPVGWTIANTNGRYLLDENGLHTLTTDGLAYASSTKQAEPPKIPVNFEEDYCLRGNLAAAIIAGGGSYVIDELDEADVVLNTITVCSLSATGSTNKTIRLGPNGDQNFAAGTVSLQPRLRMTGVSRNMILWAWDLGIHPYIMAPRKVTEGEAFAPASFETAPASAYPKGVVSAVGPAPTTAVELAEPEAPDIFLDEVDFTTLGSFPPAGWTSSKEPVATISQLVSGLYWQAKDTGTGSIAGARLIKDYVADIDGDRIAMRVLAHYFNLPSNTANQYRMSLGKVRSSDGATRVNLFRNSTNKALLLRVLNKDNKQTDYNTNFTLNTGEEMDWELRVDGGDSTQGRVRFYAGKNGAARTLRYTVSNINFTGKDLTEADACAEEWDRRSTWEVRTKRISITEDGYIGTPSAAPPPPTDLTVLPDRPSEVVGVDTLFRTWDSEGNVINQSYLFIPPGTPRFDLTDFARWPVIPGETYSFGVYGRHEIPLTEEGSLPWYLTLHNLETGAFTEIGSPYDAGAAVGISDWADRQKLSFTVPLEPGYVELRASHRNMGAGLFLWQEWAYSKSPTTITRGYGVADGPEQFYVYLDSRTLAGDPKNPKRTLTAGRLGMGVIVSDRPTGVVRPFTADATTNVITAAGHAYSNGTGVRVQTDGTLPAPLVEDTPYFVRDVSGSTFKLAAEEGGAAIDLTSAGSGIHEIFGVVLVASAYTGSDTEGVFTEPEDEDPKVIPERTFYRIKGILRGVDDVTPYIPPGGPYVVMAPNEALLLRSDRTELPGGIVINGLDMPPERAFFQTDTVGGNRRAVDVTDPVRWTNEVTLEAHTEDAMTEFNQMWWEDWIAVVPYLDNGEGLMLTLRFKEETTLLEEDIPREYRGGHRWLWAKATAIAQVTRVEPLI